MDERLLTVLRYPRIAGGATRSGDAVSERAFSNHLAVLWRQSWEPVGVGRLVAGLEDPESLPERAAFITFEGEARPVIEVALPVLRTHRAPAVLFVPTGAIGSEPEGAGAHSWNDLRLLESQDVAIEAMGVSGRRASAASPEEWEAETSGARAALEAGLDKTVRLFAWPEGDTGDEEAAAAVARAGYGAAFAHGTGINRLPGADRFRLARITMRLDTDVEWELIL